MDQILCVAFAIECYFVIKFYIVIEMTIIRVLQWLLLQRNVSVRSTCTIAVMTVLPCRLMDTPRSQLWICYTCHGKINKGVLPPECAMNNMVVEPIPAELVFE